MEAVLLDLNTMEQSPVRFEGLDLPISGMDPLEQLNNGLTLLKVVSPDPTLPYKPLFEWFTTMDSTGRITRSDPRIRKLTDFSKKGLAVSKIRFGPQNIGFALVNQQLEIVSETYEDMSEFGPGYIVKKKGRYGMVDYKGRTLVTFEHASYRKVHEIVRKDIRHFYRLSEN